MSTITLEQHHKRINVYIEKVEALEYFISISSDMERVIGNIDYAIENYGANPELESHKEILIDVWEKQNEGFKWGSDEVHVDAKGNE